MNRFNAGKTAWLIGVLFGDNPYKKEPEHSQWERGWKDANRKYNMKRQNGKRQMAYGR